MKTHQCCVSTIYVTNVIRVYHIAYTMRRQFKLLIHLLLLLGIIIVLSLTLFYSKQ